MGTHEMPIPLVSQSGSFWNPFLFNQFNISRVDIPCALTNDAGGAVRSMQRQPVTLYITVTALANTTGPDPPKNLPNAVIEGGHSPAGEPTVSGLIQFTAVEPSSPPHHPSIENDTPMRRSREEISPTEDPLLARRRADETMKAIFPIDRSKMWESAVEKINWVMDTLSPIAGVRTIPFSLFLIKLNSTQLFPLAKMAHGLLSVIPKVRLIVSYSKQSAHAMFVWMIDTP